MLYWCYALYFVCYPFIMMFVLFPKSKFTAKVVQYPYMFIAPALLNVVLMLPDTLTVASNLLALPFVTSGFFVPSQEQFDYLRGFVGSERGFVSILSHLMCWDLFVARWMFIDSMALKINRHLMSLFFTIILIVGPFGFLAYITYRSLRPGYPREMT